MGKSALQKAHETYETNLAQLQKEMYIQAFIAYEDLKDRMIQEDKQKEIRGTLVQKRHVRKKGEKTYYYTYSYLQISVYTDGKRKTKRKYISKDKLPEITQALHAKKKKDTQKQETLQQKHAALKESERQLKKHIRSGQLPAMQVLRAEAAKRYEQQKQTSTYRKKQAETEKENLTHKIRTEAGELVLSKNECIVANILYHRKIPYFYEKPLRLKPKRDGTPVVLRPDFTIQAKGKEIYIEILGMLEQENYATTWEYRLATYRVNNIQLGKNLVALEFPTAEQYQEVDCLKVLQVITDIMKNKLPNEVVRCGMQLSA